MKSMGGKRLMRDDRNVFAKYLSFFKDKSSGLLIAVIAGIISGIFLILVTPYINEKHEQKENAQILRNNLSIISLGMNGNYVDEIFGSPMVSQILPLGTFSFEEGTSDEFVSSAYKLDGCVLLCLYSDNSLVAFVVVVNDRELYKVPANIFIDESYLLDFTYADFYDKPNTAMMEYATGNVPGNNDHLAYYYEVYYGANLANYNYFIVGSYKDYQTETDSFMLMVLGQDYWQSTYEPTSQSPKLSTEEEDEYFELRRTVNPNVFGIVDERFANKFDFVFHVVGDRVNAALLFDDWADANSSQMECPLQ